MLGLVVTGGDGSAAAGARRVHLWTPEGNLPARGFYEHLGGRSAEERVIGAPPATAVMVAYVWDEAEEAARRL